MRVDTFVLFLILEGMLLVFQHWECLLSVYHIWPYSIEVSSFYANFLKKFSHKLVLNFVKDLFCIYWLDHMIFIFQFLNMVYRIYWFAYIEHPCIPGIIPTWSWGLSFLMCCWILFARVLLRIFIYVYQHYWPVVFFFVLSFQSQRKAMPKDAQTTAQLHSSHTLAK